MPGLASEKPEPASGVPQPASEEPGGGRTYVRTYGRTYRCPLYSTGLRPLRYPPGPLPKKINHMKSALNDMFLADS